MEDTPGYDHYLSFGSAHAGGFHVVFCDGSVRMLNYVIDHQVLRNLGNRHDGCVIDAKEY